MDNRLIMITGSGPGAGKSTLMSDIATTLRAHALPVLEVNEDALWGKRQLGWSPVELTGVWPEFRELLHTPRAQRSPTAVDLLQTFQRVQNRAERDGAVWIQDWSWLDVAEMWPWAKTDERLLLRFALELRTIAEQLRPAVLYLSIDPERALRRAVADRGPVWFERHAEGDVSAPNAAERLVALASMYGKREHLRRRILEDGGWTPAYIDGCGSRQAVLRAALTALGLDACTLVNRCVLALDWGWPVLLWPRRMSLTVVGIIV